MRETASHRFTAVRRAEVEIAAATAREAVVRLHVERALELVDLAAGRVGPLRMLEIYLRLLGLGGPGGDAVANRVLAAMGERGAAGPPPQPEDAGDDASVWRVLRRRLRGRVHEELRHAVELHTGVTQKAILELHVRHARAFLERIADRRWFGEACALYAEMAAVPAAVRPLLYPLVLADMAEDGGGGSMRYTTPAALSAYSSPVASRPKEVMLPRPLPGTSRPVARPSTP